MSEMILVTGGTGYIGSHVVTQLLQAGHEVVILDNLSNSQASVVERILRITGRSPLLQVGDIRDRAAVRALLAQHPVQAVIHLAGLKSVKESESQPALYYDTNVSGSLVLFEEMAQAGVFKIIFSSSATVYAGGDLVRCQEDSPLGPANVYGRTKQVVEQLLQDLQQADPRWKIALLRYFNPIGAHCSGLIGESPNSLPNNIMPVITQAAVGKTGGIKIFGQDYPTPDGTCLRDYIHVEDLAAGHLATLAHLDRGQKRLILNLGTGQPYSVLELVRAFERVSGLKIAFEFAERRPGDRAEYYADPTLAQRSLGWQAQHGLERMCEDAWRWQRLNPDGYLS